MSDAHDVTPPASGDEHVDAAVAAFVQAREAGDLDAEIAAGAALLDALTQRLERVGG